MSDAAVITFQFQSTHPGWGATKINFRHLRQYSISIHAPRVGCDNRPTCIRWRDKHFNPRTPGGVRRRSWRGKLWESYFNPRTPGGVRLIANQLPYNIIHISIHAPRVGCDLRWKCRWRCPLIISIHAPRVGCDVSILVLLLFCIQFQSTHPGWGATA